MENISNLPDHRIFTAMALLDTLGVSMEYDMFLEFAQFALTRVRPMCVTTKIIGEVDEYGLCDLPIDVKYIKAVSLSYGDFCSWKTDQEILEANGIRTTNRDGGSKTDYSNSNHRVIGEYVDFSLVDKSTIKITKGLTNSNIHVLCLAPLLDEEGMPMLTLKQVEALAYQIALLYAQRMMFQGCKGGLDIQYLTMQASRRTAQSRVPDYISDNAWNEILDVRHSHDRKSFNKDFKFRK